MLILTGLISAVNNETTANLSLSGDFDLWPLWVGDYRRLIYPRFCTFCCEAVEGQLAGSRNQRVHQETLSMFVHSSLQANTSANSDSTHSSIVSGGREEDKMIYLPHVFCVVSVTSSRTHFQVKRILLLVKTAEHLPLSTLFQLQCVIQNLGTFNHSVFLNSDDFLLSVLYSCMITTWTAGLTFSSVAIVLVLHLFIQYTHACVCSQQTENTAFHKNLSYKILF